MKYEERAIELMDLYKNLVEKKQWLCRTIKPLIEAKIDDIPAEEADLTLEAKSIQRDILERVTNVELTMSNPYDNANVLSNIKDIVAFYRKETMDMLGNTTLLSLELYIISRKDNVKQEVIDDINAIISKGIKFTINDSDMRKCIDMYDAGVVDDAIKFLNDLAQSDLEEKENKEECEVKIDEEVKKTKKKSKKKQKKAKKKEDKRFDKFKKKLGEGNEKKAKIAMAVAGVAAIGFGLFKMADAYMNKDDVVVIDSDLR